MTLEKAAGIIPARYGATRFPGKPLASILGKPMIQWVYEGAKKSKLLKRIIIATDDQRIVKAADEFGAEAVMTSTDHESGTERVAEAAAQVEAEIIVNIQGDEPLVGGEMLDALVIALDDPSISMATLMAKVTDMALLQDSHVVKVVTDKNGFALYFSRSPLPYQAPDHFFQHIGIYGYRKDFLMNFHRLPVSRLERIEKLEQLRVLENGMPIQMIEIPRPTLSVDTPQDIIKVEKLLSVRTHE
ncbi:MAG: 3-deoxy-manno-octulosonate cytidylyltransferase [Candidatus Aminicenantes bacterium]|nr:3-deoxy-manno-octulosonate cytidylyltransferase [Candidatus Aminicenantes bacterium]